jgi:hypothetical protein
MDATQTQEITMDVKKQIADLRWNWRDDVSSYACCEVLEEGKTWRWWRNVPAHWYAFLNNAWRPLLGATWCKWRGHDLEFDHVCGPESGAEYWNCNRCGWSHRHIYY